MLNIHKICRKGHITAFLVGLLVFAVIILRQDEHINHNPRLSDMLLNNHTITTSKILNHSTTDYTKQPQNMIRLTSTKRRPTVFLRNHKVCSGPRSSYITVCFKSKDQLGNQMFQYASTFCFAKLNNFRLLWDKTKDISKTYNLSAIQIDPLQLQKNCDDGERLRDFVVAKFNLNRLHFTCSKNITIHGYMQSYANFKECTADVMKEFVFRSQANLRAKAEALILKSTKCRYNFYDKTTNKILLIAIHARRGDYVGNFYPEAHAQYYIKAINHFLVKYGRKCVFVVLTNSDSKSRKWCYNNIVRNSTDTYLVDVDSASVHLYILSHSDHVIISVGTYGWWGAFLNQNATVVKWNVFYKSKTYHHSEFYPSNWIVMEGDQLGNTENERRHWWGGM